MKKVIAFDLDGTLAESKSALTDRTSELLDELLENYEVCVISGGKFEQFETQLLANLKISNHQLAKIHIMPTCGTRYHRYDDVDGKWKQIYSEDIVEKDRKRIMKILEEGAKTLGLWENKTWGGIIEDRGSQITFSALGQEAPVKNKHSWDPTGEKKIKLRDYVAEKLPEFEVRTGGSTSVDVTKLGIDKAYGMENLMKVLEISKEEILFIGDALQEGGNDYPVKAMGIDCIEVQDYKDTMKIIETILKVTK